MPRSGGALIMKKATDDGRRLGLRGLRKRRVVAAGAVVAAVSACACRSASSRENDARVDGQTAIDASRIDAPPQAPPFATEWSLDIESPARAIPVGMVVFDDVAWIAFRQRICTIDLLPDAEMVCYSLAKGEDLGSSPQLAKSGAGVAVIIGNVGYHIGRLSASGDGPLQWQESLDQPSAVQRSALAADSTRVTAVVGQGIDSRLIRYSIDGQLLVNQPLALGAERPGGVTPGWQTGDESIFVARDPLAIASCRILTVDGSGSPLYGPLLGPPSFACAAYESEAGHIVSMTAYDTVSRSWSLALAEVDASGAAISAPVISSVSPYEIRGVAGNDLLLGGDSGLYVRSRMDLDRVEHFSFPVGPGEVVNTDEMWLASDGRNAYVLTGVDRGALVILRLHKIAPVFAE